MDDTNKKEIILVAVDDIFFVSKIRGTAEALDVSIVIVRTTEKFFQKLKETNPIRIIVDLHSEKIDALLIAKTLKGEEQTQAIRLVGFFSHVHTELMNKAIDAGYDEVMPRSAFTKKLPQMLKGVK